MNPIDTSALEPKKAELINNFAELAKGKSTEEMLPLLLAVSKKAKKEGISFSSEETNALINIIKKDLPPKEQSRIDLFLQMLGQM